MKSNEFGFFKKGYLLLKRKAGQGFHVNNEVEVVIAKIEGETAFVAVKAPDKRVVRNEIMGNEPRSESAVRT